MAQATQHDTEAAQVARRYFEALGRHDLEDAVACWAPGGTDRMVGMADLPAPAGVRRYFSDLFAAFPDFEFEIIEQTTEGGASAVRWRAQATFAGPGSFQGVEPNGAKLDFEGCDVVQVRDGLIQHNDAYVDGMSLARQIGLLPPPGSPAEQRLNGAFNALTKARGAAVPEAEPVADGVWLVRGGFPLKTMNVYLVRDGDGVLAFDAGISGMTRQIAAVAAKLGGLTRVVLGHAHQDHRGAAPGLGVPVYCHPAERADAEGDGGEHYFRYGELGIPARWLYPHQLKAWDGGPVTIAGTVEEGDDVAGFQVLHLPGHSPGLIALWRESDRLALTSDVFYTLNPETTRKGPPRVPLTAFNLDTEQARASLRRLASLEPVAAWPGHAEPVTGDVRAQLEQAAAG